ncbi:MAG: hypothetical protein IJ035_08895 [Oscillospiraceae bacterium]|nr:hypothetical protein [Oscillospiraceae bacterium]
MNTMMTETDMNELAKCKVYFYKGKKAKSHMHVFIVSVLIIIPTALILGFLMSKEIIDQSVIAWCLIGAFLLMVAYIVKTLQFDATKALTQYFVDSEGSCYKIQFTKVSTRIVKVNRQYSAVPLVGEVKTLIDSVEKLKTKEEYMEEAYNDAQNKVLGFYYVRRFKQGIKDWDWFSGGEAKVIFLGKENEVRIPEVYAP